MSDFHLSYYFIKGNGSMRKKKTKQYGNVKTAQQRILILVQHALFNHKQHSHHHHRHVVMPAALLSGLVFTHSTLIFGILEKTLNPISLSLHECQPFTRAHFFEGKHSVYCYNLIYICNELSFPPAISLTSDDFFPLSNI